VPHRALLSCLRAGRAILTRERRRAKGRRLARRRARRCQRGPARGALGADQPPADREHRRDDHRADEVRRTRRAPEQGRADDRPERPADVREELNGADGGAAPLGRDEAADEREAG
jgi:hypothetical protein